MSFSPSVFKFDDLGGGKLGRLSSEEAILEILSLLDLKLNKCLVRKTHSIASHGNTLALADPLEKRKIMSKKERAVACESEAAVATVCAVIR